MGKNSENGAGSSTAGDNVRSSRSQRRRTSLAAAVAGVSTAAILLSSGTVALWQDAVKMDGGNITAGNLDVEKLGTLDWFENSDDVSSKGSLVDLTSYKTTPGDSLLGKQKLDVGLEGDNLYATANVTFPTLPSGELYATPDGVALSYVVVDRDGNEVTAETPVGQTSAAWNIKVGDVSGKVVDNTVDYVVQIKAMFDKNTSERTRVQTQAMLGKLQFNIQQVRSPIAAASTVTKTLSSSTIKAGDEVTVSYTVNNIGAETLTNVTIDDPLLTAAGVDLSSVKIAPGGSHTFTAKIKVTKDLSQQADLFNGGVTSNATSDSSEVTSTGGVSSSSNVVAYSADMSIVGSAKINDLNGDGALDYNETVTYSWVVKNTGSDTIKNVNVVAVGSPTSTESGDVASGASRTFTATYSPTSDDLLSVLNVSATANGLAAFDNALVTVSSAPVSVNTVKPAPNASFVPTATLSTDKNSDGVANVGDVMTFTAKLTNTGNVALNDVKISGSLAGVNWDKTTVASVAPGETVAFTGTKTLEATDLASGAVVNKFNITYLPAASSGSLVDNGKSESVVVPAQLNTSATVTGSYVIDDDSYEPGKVSPGESVKYSYVVKNTGDEPLKDVAVSTSFGAASSTDSGELGAGESRTFTSTLTPTATQLNVGKLSNTVSISGVGSWSGATTNSSSNVNVDSVPVVSTMSITGDAKLSTDVNGNRKADTGDVITMDYTVTNTGNESVSQPVVTVWDTTLTPKSSGVIGRGNSASYSGSRTVTANDLKSDTISISGSVNATGVLSGKAINASSLVSSVPVVGAQILSSNFSGYFSNDYNRNNSLDFLRTEPDTYQIYTNVRAEKPVNSYACFHLSASTPPNPAYSYQIYSPGGGLMGNNNVRVLLSSSSNIGYLLTGTGRSSTQEYTTFSAEIGVYDNSNCSGGLTKLNSYTAYFYVNR